MEKNKNALKVIMILFIIAVLACLGLYAYKKYVRDANKPIDNGGEKIVEPTPEPGENDEPVNEDTPSTPTPIMDNGKAEAEGDDYILNYDKITSDVNETSPDAVDLTKKELTKSDQTFKINNIDVKVKSDGNSLYINDNPVDMQITEEWYLSYMKGKYNLYWNSNASHAILTANIDYACTNIVVGTIDSSGTFAKIKYVPDSRYGPYMIDRIACLGRMYTKDSKIYGQYTYNSLYVKKGDKAPMFKIEFDI